MKFNRICFLGAPCVGKTTVIKPLRNKYNSYSIHSQFNTIKEEFFPNKNILELNETQIIELGTKAIEKRIDLEKNQKILLSEGGILYDLAWIIYITKYILKKSIKLTYIEKLILKNLKNYNLTIYIPIEFEFINRNKEFESKNTQKEINNIIIILLKKFKINYITLRGTEKERYKSIIKLIE